MAHLHTHYDNLKVARDAPLNVIKAAFRTLSQKYHPDRNSEDPEALRIMVILNVSYDVLSDPQKRSEHDSWIIQQEKTTPEANSASQRAVHPEPPSNLWTGSDEPLPLKMSNLLHESSWLAALAMALYLALILLTFDKADPVWPHSAGVEGIRNSGGQIGAWLADIFFRSFGLSAWWLFVLCGFVVRWNFLRIENQAPSDSRSSIVAGIGFAVLLAASASLESLRFYNLKAVLPLAPGGMLGSGLGGALSTAIGFAGATLVLLALIAIGLSLFTGMSWVVLIERIGAKVEWGYRIGQKKWQDWRR